MALAQANHRFGPAEIGGSARVHQGDKNVSNSFYICKAIFSSAQPLNDHAAVSNKRCRDDQDDPIGRCVCRTKRCRVSRDDVVADEEYPVGVQLPETAALVPRVKRRIEYDEDLGTETRKRVRRTQEEHEEYNAPRGSSILQNFDEASTRAVSNLPPFKNRQPQDSTFSGSAHVANPKDSSRNGVLLIALEQLRQAMYSPTILRNIFGFIRPEHALPPQDTSPPEQHISNVDTLRAIPINKPVQEVVAICVFLLSCLTYRNVSGKDISKIVAKCQEDRILPLLTWLFGLGVARYLYLNQISRSLSGLTGDCIILEDAFQQHRRVSMSTCEHFSILKAFLEVHYQGRAGEPLVKAGQFNLTLGSRRGMAIRPSDWATKGRVRAGSNVVMSIYVRTDDAKCTACLSVLRVTPMGEFFCDTCKRFYRDCDTLRYFTEVTERKAKRMQHLPLSEPCTNSEDGTVNNTTATGSESDQEIDYDTSGLKNIDLRIVPRQNQNTTPMSPNLFSETPMASSGYGDSASRNSNYLYQLAEYHQQHGVPLDRFPVLDKRTPDLYMLKRAVEVRGGFQTVCRDKKWPEIGQDLGYSGKATSSLSTSLKNFYQRWLHPYEEWLRHIGSGVNEEAWTEASASSSPVHSWTYSTDSPYSTEEVLELPFHANDSKHTNQLHVAEDVGMPLGGSNAAIKRYEERARQFETASRAASWGTRRRLSDGDIESMLNTKTVHLSLNKATVHKSRTNLFQAATFRMLRNQRPSTQQEERGMQLDESSVVEDSEGGGDEDDDFDEEMNYDHEPLSAKASEYFPSPEDDDRYLSYSPRPAKRVVSSGTTTLDSGEYAISRPISNRDDHDRTVQEVEQWLSAT